MTTKKADHDYCQLLIPWYVNGTLDEVDMVAVESHLAGCAQCWDQVELELNFSREYVISDTNVREHPSRMEAELNKLLITLDKSRKRCHSKSVRAVALATFIIALSASVFILDRTWQIEDKRYQTLTSALEATNGAVYQTIFDKDESPEDIQKILDAAGMEILNGPSQQGVYRIAIPNEIDSTKAIEFLKSHANLLFIEKEING